MFYCAEADWDMSYKPPKTLLFLFEVHTSLENPVLYITFFFSFAFNSFVYTNELSGALFTKLCIQDTDILVLLRRGSSE